jgi:hypothetical protein
MTLARMIRINHLTSTTTIPGLREAEDRDIPQLAALFTKFMERYSMVPIFSEQELQHQLLSGRGTGKIGDGGAGRRQGQVTWTYVVEVSRMATQDTTKPKCYASRIRNHIASRTSSHSTHCHPR